MDDRYVRSPAPTTTAAFRHCDALGPISVRRGSMAGEFSPVGLPSGPIATPPGWPAHADVPRWSVGVSRHRSTTARRLGVGARAVIRSTGLPAVTVSVTVPARMGLFRHCVGITRLFSRWPSTFPRAGSDFSQTPALSGPTHRALPHIQGTAPTSTPRGGRGTLSSPAAPRG